MVAKFGVVICSRAVDGEPTRIDPITHVPAWTSRRTSSFRTSSVARFDGLATVTVYGAGAARSNTAASAAPGVPGGDHRPGSANAPSEGASHRSSSARAADANNGPT